MRLGGAILIDERAVRQARKKRRDLAGDPQSLSGNDNLRQGLRRRASGGRDREALQSNVGQEQPGNPLLFDQVVQRLGVAPGGLVDQHQRSAGAPGREDLLKGDVESERGELQRPLTEPDPRSPQLP